MPPRFGELQSVSVLLVTPSGSPEISAAQRGGLRRALATALTNTSETLLCVFQLFKALHPTLSSF